MSAIANKRILVVEDQFFIADDIASTLTDAGAVVLGPCATRSEAFEIAAGTEIDAAILDIGLDNGLTVYPLAERLRESGVPFAFYTGYERQILPSQFATSPFISKPCDSAGLLEAVECLVSHQRSNELKTCAGERT